MVTNGKGKFQDGHGREPEELAINPISHDTKVIEGYTEKLFRVRVGDYRILYEVDYTSYKIGVVKIDKRSTVYN